MNPFLAAQHLLAETLHIDLEPVETADGDFDWRRMTDARGFSTSAKAIIRLAESIWSGALAEAASSLDDANWDEFTEALLILRGRANQSPRCS